MRQKRARSERAHGAGKQGRLETPNSGGIRGLAGSRSQRPQEPKGLSQERGKGAHRRRRLGRTVRKTHPYSLGPKSFSSRPALSLLPLIQPTFPFSLFTLFRFPTHVHRHRPREGLARSSWGPWSRHLSEAPPLEPARFLSPTQLALGLSISSGLTPAPRSHKRLTTPLAI